MNQEPRMVRVVITCQQLLTSRDACIDFETGDIVPAAGCPKEQIGLGRVALAKGKQFIRIPSVDEIRDRLEAEFDRTEKMLADVEQRLQASGSPK